jgi:hypothetical protein
LGANLDFEISSAKWIASLSVRGSNGLGRKGFGALRDALSPWTGMDWASSGVVD